MSQQFLIFVNCNHYESRRKGHIFPFRVDGTLPEGPASHRHPRADSRPGRQPPPELPLRRGHRPVSVHRRGREGRRLAERPQYDRILRRPPRCGPTALFPQGLLPLLSAARAGVAHVAPSAGFAARPSAVLPQGGRCPLLLGPGPLRLPQPLRNRKPGQPLARTPAPGGGAPVGRKRDFPDAVPGRKNALFRF